jgi:hypothetical protein
MITFLVLGGTVVLATSLAQRRGPAVSRNLAALETAPPVGSQVVYRQLDMFPDSTFEIELRHLQRGMPALQVGVRNIRPFEIAAGHLYWQPLQPVDGALANNASGLGPLPDGRWVRYPLPPLAEQRDGYLLLYSAAHDSVLAATLLPSAGVVGSDGP